MSIKGEGPVPCEFVLVGEGPGYQEAEKHRFFVGKTGQELTRYLDGVHLPRRPDIFLTNLYRLYQGKDYRWTEQDLQRDEPLLLEELRQVCPHILITMGRHATRYFLGDVDLDAVQGIPFYLPAQEKFSMLPEGTVVFPLVHIAAGFHNADMSPYVVSGFQQLSLYLDGQIEPRFLFDDPYPEPQYAEITSLSALRRATAGLTTDQLLAIDTEGWPHNPWSLQFSFEPGRGYLIRADRPDLLRAFLEGLRRVRPRLVFHSALHDLSMGRALGTDFKELAFDDTMVMAYLLQIEPQGLKAGCLRSCNMQMDDYADIMGDADDRLACEYLTWLWDMEQVDYEANQVQAFNEALLAGRRVKVLPKLPKSALQKAVGRCLASKRPRGLWLDQVEDLRVVAHARLGAVPEATLDYVPQRTAVRYGCRDADATLRYRQELSPKLDAMGLREVYNLELATYPLIDRMQRIGLKPDLDHFARLSLRLAEEIAQLQNRLVGETGRVDFNANSGNQVADYLFGELGLEELKMTPAGDRGSTNDKILEALEHEHPEHPVLSTIRSYREIYKLKHTFVDCLPEFVHRWPYDGRVHTTFRTTRVVTGRLASSDPNVLAQPEHGKFAPDFKRGWVAEDGHVLCAWDESQVELRGLAHLSQDPVLLHAFRTGQDLHAKLAVRIFGGKESQYLGKCYERFAVKEINFGIPNGMQAKGLCVALRSKGVEATEDTAQKWLDETLALYKGVVRYMNEREAEAKQRGYIRCLSGRIRYIGGIQSYDDRIREEAKRLAFSTPIQESAAWIMKQTEAIVYEDILVPLWRQGRWVEPILQVHDCLKVECEEGLEQDLHLMMQEAMTNVPKGFSVPLAVEGEWGSNMADMEKFK